MGFPPNSGPGPWYRFANGFADTGLLVHIGKDKGIAVIAFAHQHTTGFGPAAHGLPVLEAIPLRGKVQVALSAQEGFEVVVQPASTVETGIHHQALAIKIFAQDFIKNVPERTIVHALNVHITQGATAQAMHLVLHALHPTGVHQAGFIAQADGLHHLLDTLGIHRVTESHQGVFAGLAVEQGRPIGPVIDGNPVDFFDDSTGPEGRGSFAKGTFGQHLGDLETGTGETLVVEQAQAGGFIPLGIRRRIATPGMRCVELAQEFGKQFLKIVIVVKMGQEFSVIGIKAFPIDAVDLGIVKFLNHLAVGMIEDVGPFGFGVQFHFTGYTDGLALAVLVNFGQAPLLEGKEAFAVFADFQTTPAGP